MRDVALAAAIAAFSLVNAGAAARGAWSGRISRRLPRTQIAQAGTCRHVDDGLPQEHALRGRQQGRHAPFRIPLVIP